MNDITTATNNITKEKLLEAGFKEEFGWGWCFMHPDIPIGVEYDEKNNTFQLCAREPQYDMFGYVDCDRIKTLPYQIESFRRLEMLYYGITGKILMR